MQIRPLMSDWDLASRPAVGDARGRQAPRRTPQWLGGKTKQVGSQKPRQLFLQLQGLRVDVVGDPCSYLASGNNLQVSSTTGRARR